MDPGFAAVERAVESGPIPGAAAAIGNRDDGRMACFGRTETGGAGATTGTSAGDASEADADATVKTGAGAADETSATDEGEADADATMREDS